MKKLLISALLLASCVSFAKAKPETTQKQGFRKPANVECPASYQDDNYEEKVETAIKATKTCYDAKALASACAMGTSMDVHIVRHADEKCSERFFKKLSKADKAMYDKLQKKCYEKYGKMEGTMYKSANAFCNLGVTELFDDLFTPAE